MYKKWLALFLAVAMMFSLVACTGKTPAETTQPTESTTETTVAPTTEPPTTEPPAPTAMDYFTEAKDALLAANALSLTAETKHDRTVGKDSYSRTEKITALYEGLQGELLSKLEGTLLFEDAEYEATYNYTEQFVGGITYATVETAKHREEISAEDYLSRRIPLCLFDATNFNASEIQEDGAAITLTFTEAQALESWVAPEYAELLSAKATAKIENGIFTEMTYSATFSQGTADLAVAITTSLAVPTETTLTPEAPAEAESYTLVSHVEAPRLMEEAIFNLDTPTSMNASLIQVISSQAAGYAAQVNTNIHDYGTGSDYKVKIATDITQISQAGQETMKTEEVFADGKYTYSVDGEVSDEGTVDASYFSEAISSMVGEYLPAGAWITEAILHDMEEGYLIEFTSQNDECRDFYKDLTSSEIFGDNTVLDDNASAYAHDVLSGYFGIDKDTMTPTSFSIDFKGTHTIQGIPCLLSQQVYGGFTAPDANTYKEITNELPAEEEPAEKASPVFYHVTGANGEEMWLLGTIHIGDSRTGFLPQEIYSALEASDALAVEFDLNSAEDAMEEDEAFAQKIAALMTYSDGTTVEDHLDAETYEAALRYLKYIGDYYPGVEAMKASLWETSITNAMLDGHGRLTSDKGVDQRLLDLAEASGKEILSVESMESQMAMLAGFSDELQEYLLKASVELSRAEYVSGVEELFEAWCVGDEAALRQLLNEEEAIEDPTEAALAKEYKEAMSTNRDKGMVETAKGYLDSGRTVFYAVGLAHLLADNGLVDSLRAAGYTVELVTYAN